MNIKITLLIGIFLLHIGEAFAAEIQRIDHYIPIVSTAPSEKGETIKLFLHEVKQNGKAVKSDGAVLFIHGSGDPAEAVFDTQYKDYSWMSFIAQHGYTSYALDLTGYGRSHRPEEMSNPCNLPPQEQQQLIPSMLSETCATKHRQMLTTLESDLTDINAAIDFIRQKDKVNSVAIIGWSIAGVRTFNYLLQHPEKVSKLVLLAPVYIRKPIQPLPIGYATDNLMNALNHEDFIQEWNDQVKCKDQISENVREAFWAELLASDPVGATWATGLRRRPAQLVAGNFNSATAPLVKIPTLLIAGEHDTHLKEVAKTLYEDLGSTQKVFIDLACSSHNAIWEKNYRLLFQASVDWLKASTINGKSTGQIRMGYTR